MALFYSVWEMAECFILGMPIVLAMLAIILKIVLISEENY